MEHLENRPSSDVHVSGVRHAGVLCLMKGQAYRVRRLQLSLLQAAENTHRLLDPVSKSTSKFCGGVPRETFPKYWES